MKNPMYFFFNKFLKESYNFHGLILVPTYNSNSDSIVWEVKNPENKSYCIQAITEKPNELFYDFSQITSQNEFYQKNWQRACKFNKPENYYYLNRSDERELNNRLKSITNIDYRDFYTDVVCTHYQIWPYEDFTIEIGMKLMNPINKETGEKLKGDSLNDKLVSLVEDEDFFNSYEYQLFSPIISFFRYNPLFFDDGYMYFTNSIDWRTPDNKRIELKF